MVLLDTCVLLWLASDHTKLSAYALDRIARKETILYISSITSFEIALKYYRKKLLLPADPGTWLSTILQHHGIQEIPIDFTIATAAAGLPEIHRDPADRFIIATSQAHAMELLTPDPLIKLYPDTCVRW